MAADDTATLSAFTAGDLVISVVGDGDGSGTYTDNQAAPITLEEITTTGTAVGQLVLPQTTTVVNGTTEYAISGEYGSSSEGALQLAADGQSLVIMGYGVNAVTYNTGGAAVYGDAALAQSTSLTDSNFTPVARIVADISFDGTVDTSTALYNIFNTNNGRSAATVDGTSFYVSGQGVKGDTTQGVFYAQDGANSATAIDTSTDTRDVQIIDGQLYVSRDSKQGTDGTSNIGTYGTELPITATTATILPGIAGTVTLTAGQENGINNSEVGQTVHLSPESYFFADATTLYVADGGNPKAGGLGDGGLQKWTYDGTSWVLDYTLASGLNLVPDTATSGTTGLIGLTGTVVNGVVELYATNSTIGDLDQTYLYGIDDTLSATTLPTDESFTTLMTAAADTNIRGISFAPTASDVTPTDLTITATQSSGGLTVTSGSTLTVLNGGTITGAIIQSGGAATISSGGSDIGSTIAQGATETVIGIVSSDVVQGTQLLNVSGAVVSDETVYNGGAVDLFIKGTGASDITLTNGGVLAINGNATVTNVAIMNGGTIMIESPKATIDGAIVFDGAGTLQETALSSAGFGISALISGFGTSDSIDLTTFGSGTLATIVSGGDTVATVTSNGDSASFTFAGIVSGLSLASDGAGGERIILGSGSTSSGGSTISSGTVTGVIVSGGETLTVNAGGTIVGATIQSGGSAIVSGTDNGAVIQSGGSELILGTANGDQITGTQVVSSATAVVSGETVFNGGVLDLFLKGAIASSTVVENGGALNISGNAFVTDVTLMGGSLLETQSPKANVTGTLTFDGPATLREADIISGGFGVIATISGFAAGDVIDITSYDSSAVLTSAVVSGNTEVTLADNGASQTFTFAGLYDDGFFNVESDGGSGIELTAAPCFATGTRILTERGEVAVEALRISDRVITATGEARPIRWIGHRAVDCRRHAAPESVRPVRVPAHAFGRGLPARDLLLSPDHALFAEGVLVPVKHLLGAGGIARSVMETVTYWHVELDRHDVLLAEGLPAESYLDTGDRAAFGNGAEPMALHPSWGSERGDITLAMDALGCAPLRVTGPEVERIRAGLDAAASAEPRRLFGG